jgi:acetyltransferase-like isoleucine patch superfamily enzyme
MRLIKLFRKKQELIVQRGKHTYGPDPIIVGHPSIGEGSRIGNFCSIADGLQFIFRGKHMVNWISTYPFREKWDMDVPLNDLPSHDPIIIGNDVWIASHVRVQQGVIIGDGAVIAMESLVTKDVPPYAMVGGHPAEIIRYRFSKSQIERLIKIAWWFWDDEDIKKVVPLLVSDDIDRFIEIAEGMVQAYSLKKPISSSKGVTLTPGARDEIAGEISR